MLREILQYLLTPTEPSVQALGYLRESIAIESRLRRCREAWQPHLEQCRRHILAAAEKLKPGSHIVIIGSGGLHDVPVRELLDMGMRLSLIDVVHLPAVTKPFRNNRNVRFIAMDVTGRVDDIYNRRDPEQGRPPETRGGQTPDLAVSLNILSQLPLLPVKYLDKKGITLAADFAERIMVQHLDWITGFKAPVLLFSDLERLYCDFEKPLEKEAALPEAVLQRLGEPLDQWDWHIAPLGEADADVEIRHRVGYWEIP